MVPALQTSPSCSPPSNDGLQPDNRRGDRQRGFSLVELAVATSLIGIFFASIAGLVTPLFTAIRSSSTNAVVSARTQAVLTRLSEECLTGGFLSLTPPTPTLSNRIRFDKVVGFSYGTPIFGNPVQIEYVEDENDGANGVDDDGDGLTDEGVIRIWEDFSPLSSSPGPEDAVTIIARNVADDGLLFTRNGASLTIEISLTGVGRAGETPFTTTLSTDVRMRND